MTRHHTAHLDITAELRLRRWARENHVPAHLRGPDWHPIVLDEMQARDAEIDALVLASQPDARYAPLEPTSTRLLHGPHGHLAGPHAATRVEAPAAASCYFG